ncbi:MAG: tetratricopeptide repeat protein [Moorea sp. SIO1F2]|uniref:tetratricopeptide repeat protein n=1 Tax=Moorena sp. SIO1F2 TaxID=2607819 RepID=UPI0013BD6BFB|nr:tetratricopeptide repeat protein [Moorena sp. SIO1F2]NET82123.1 tetratricopeptide repeat protein [Moorena sp. SIO1F2]
MSLNKPKRPTIWATALVSLISVGLITPLPTVGQTTIAQQQESAQAQLTKAKQLNQQVIELYKQGKYSEAIPLAREALKIRQQVLGEEHLDVATSLNNLGLLYYSMGRYQQAEPLYTEALEMRRRLLGDQHPDVTTSLNNLAGLYYFMGRYQQAEPLYTEALEMRRRLLGNQHPSVALILNNLGGLYKSMGRYQQAEPLYTEALDMRRRLLGNEHPDVALSLNNLAVLYSSMGRYQQAEPLYTQALDMRRRLLGNEHPDVASSLNNLALLYESMGRYQQAEPLYTEALDMRRRLLGNEHPDVATSLNNLAALYYFMGRYQQAEPLYNQTLAMRRGLLGDEHPDVATSLSGLAALYKSMGRYQQAEPLYNQALEMRRRLLGNEHPDVAASLNNLALLYSSIGRYQQAESLYTQALEMRRRLLGNEHPDVAASLNNLALLYKSMGRYQQAEPLYTQALEMMKRLLGHQHPDVATSLNNLALLYESMERYQQAEPLLTQALDMRRQLLGDEHPDVATNLNNLALLYESMGRYQQAEPLYTQALEMYKRLLGHQHPDVATSLNNLAALYKSMGRYQQAEPLYTQALEMYKRLLGEEHPNVAASLNNLAGLHHSQGNIEQALEFLEAGLDIQELNLERNLVSGAEKQKREYIKTISGTRDAAISLHLNSAGDNERAAGLALTTILRRKGRLLDFLTHSQQLLRKRLDFQSQKLLDRLNNTRTQLANLTYNRPDKLPLEEYRNQLDELTNQEQQLVVKISRRSREFAQINQPVTIETIQQLIPLDTALVEFVEYKPYNPQKSSWGNPRYAAYVLRSQGSPQGIDLGEVDALKPLWEILELSLQDKGVTIPQLKQAGRKVDEKLMAKVRPLLGDSRRILLSPDTHLNLIPFEALVDQDNRYLVESYGFTYLTSGRDLLRLSNPNRKLTKPVLLGAPDFENSAQTRALGEENQIVATRSLGDLNPSELSLSPIPGALEEVNAIAKMLDVEPLLGAQANEAALKQVTRPRILHIATHGFFQNRPDSEEFTNGDNALLWSWLALAGIKNNKPDNDLEDGIFTALEATGLNLSGTKLVVLSACDTGLGNISAGEGIYGLRRALVIAGSESQVISLWNVNDTATKYLMVSYYQGLQDNQGRSEALRRIQLQMLGSPEYQHPYYWASFIPSGNWRSMVEE